MYKVTPNPPHASNAAPAEQPTDNVFLVSPNPAALPQGGNLNPPCHPAKFHNSLRL
jgi:hypothetical protein